MTKEKSIKCYFCHGVIDDDELEVKKIPIETTAGVRNYSKKFHSECVGEYEMVGAPKPKPKKVAKPKKLELEEVHKCYYCDGVIESVNDIAWKKFPMATKKGEKWFNRKLHVDCLIKYNEGTQDIELKKQENDAWELVYNYFRKELLGLGDTNKLDQHTVKRLLGLRLGQYYPSANNTRLLPRGYSFETILLTMKVVKSKIVSYLSTANFANGGHKTNGIMTFIVSEINDVQKRIDMQKKSNEKLDKDVVKPVFDYKADLKRKEENTKIKDDTDIDLGGLF